MPQYLFEKDTGEIAEVTFRMSDDKTYNGEDGTEVGRWKRIFVNPQLSVDSHIDPFDKNAFANSKYHTYGDMLDKSAELSEKRAEARGGVDPVKQKALDEYAKKRHGKRHPVELKEGIAKSYTEANKTLGKLGIKLNPISTPRSRRLT